ncbi:hypothetical protein BDZ91DRAFT_712071 [Kalaharituber pfeilii]|nr:hypothetical protein BDZ91DRAFT_712071 [Kalaharituber pfeilii]
MLLSVPGGSSLRVAASSFLIGHTSTGIGGSTSSACFNQLHLFNFLPLSAHWRGSDSIAWLGEMRCICNPAIKNKRMGIGLQQSAQQYGVTWKQVPLIKGAADRSQARNRKQQAQA